MSCPLVVASRAGHPEPGPMEAGTWALSIPAPVRPRPLAPGPWELFGNRASEWLGTALPATHQGPGPFPLPPAPVTSGEPTPS